jgi:hypothetical protein
VGHVTDLIVTGDNVTRMYWVDRTMQWVKLIDGKYVVICIIKQTIVTSCPCTVSYQKRTLVSMLRTRRELQMSRKRGRPLHVVPMSADESRSKLQRIINACEPGPPKSAAELLAKAAGLLDPRHQSHGHSTVQSKKRASKLKVFDVSSQDQMRSHIDEAMIVLTDGRHGLTAALSLDSISIVALYYQEPTYIFETDRGRPYDGRSEEEIDAIRYYNKYNVDAETRGFDGFVLQPANVYVSEVDHRAGARFLAAEPLVYAERDQHQYQGFERENADGTLDYVMLIRTKTTIRILDPTIGLILRDHVWLRRGHPCSPGTLPPALICTDHAYRRTGRRLSIRTRCQHGWCRANKQPYRDGIAATYKQRSQYDDMVEEGRREEERIREWRVDVLSPAELQQADDNTTRDDEPDPFLLPLVNRSSDHNQWVDSSVLGQ